VTIGNGKVLSKMKTAKRLDGRKKLISLTSKMEADIRSFRRDRGIQSDSELIRKAIAKYIYTDYKDVTLNRYIMKQIQELFARCQLSVTFK